jgi:predicted DNA-binding ribbon-helix-helix protein
MHNVVVGRKRTSVRLEPVMWDALHDIARRRRLSVGALVTEIDRWRTGSGRTAAIRVYIVEFYRAAGSADERGVAGERRPLSQAAKKNLMRGLPTEMPAEAERSTAAGRIRGHTTRRRWRHCLG